MKTIGRNRKALIESVFTNAKNARSFSLDNGFRGKEVSIEWVRKEFDTFNFAKLQSLGNGDYHVTVHGNQWYEFQSVQS